MNGVMESTDVRAKLVTLRLRREIHARNCSRCFEHLGFCWISQKFEVAIHKAEMLLHGVE